MVGLVDLNHQPRPYQGFLWCYTHSIIFMRDVNKLARMAWAVLAKMNHISLSVGDVAAA